VNERLKKENGLGEAINASQWNMLNHHFERKAVIHILSTL
jgi:hypothetical protein